MQQWLWCVFAYLVLSASVGIAWAIVYFLSGLPEDEDNENRKE